LVSYYSEEIRLRLHGYGLVAGREAGVSGNKLLMARGGGWQIGLWGKNCGLNISLLKARGVEATEGAEREKGNGGVRKWAWPEGGNGETGAGANDGFKKGAE